MEENCKYKEIIRLLEKRVDTMSKFLIISTSIFLLENFILLLLICILVSC